MPNTKHDAVMKAMGMAFDHTRQRWVFGKVPSGAEVVSFGGRRLDVLDAGGDDLLKPRPAVAAAAAHLQEVLRAAREEAVALQPTVLQRVAVRHEGVYLWAVGQALAMTLAANVMVSDGLDSTVLAHDSMRTLGLGAVAGLIAVFCDRKKWALQPGLEPAEGALERQLVDAALGVVALPAPWDWRAATWFWKAGALLFEGTSAATGCALVHGVVQAHVLAPWAQRMVDGGPPLDPLLTDSAWFSPSFEVHAVVSNGLGDDHAAAATLAVVALAALAALAEAAQWPCPEAAGAAAEVAAAARVRKSAHAYFAGTRLNRIASLSAFGDTRAAAAAEAADTTVALADAWERKFAVPTARAAWELPFLAAISTGLAATAFELSGGDLRSPVACAAAVLLDRYALRPSVQTHGRATATLPAHAAAIVEAAAFHAQAERAIARADGP